VHVYGDMVERYFQSLRNSVGGCDGDRLKVVSHDFKALLKRLAYEDSFSRDTHGGGPEHNMHLIPLFVQMSYYLLTQNNGSGPYPGEKEIDEYLEAGVKPRKEIKLDVEMQEESKEESSEEPVLTGAAGSLALD